MSTTHSGKAEKCGSLVLDLLWPAGARRCRDLISILTLVAITFVVSWAEYGLEGAAITILAIAALGIHLWLFVTVLACMEQLIRKRLAFEKLVFASLLATAALALHLLSPVSLGAVVKTAIAMVAVVFAAIKIFIRRR